MYWDAPRSAQVEFVNLYIAESYESFGALCFAASCKMIYQEGSGVMNWFEGNISAAQVTDRTPGYDGTAQDALSEIVNTRSIDGEIDHSSLPALARATINRVEKINRRIVEYTDPSGRIVEDEVYDTEIVEEEGRSLGGMITVLTEAVKGLNERVVALEAENQTLKTEVAVLKAQ